MMAPIMRAACLVWSLIIGCWLLGWQNGFSRADDSPPERMSSRDILLPSTLDQLEAARDDADLPPEGDELVWRMLYAVRRFPLLDLHRSTQSKLTPQAVREAPSASRAEAVAWRGTITRATAYDLPPDVAERFDLSRYYRCELLVAEGTPPVIVYSLAVPKAWRLNGSLSERAEVRGLFVRLAGASPVVVARRVAWYPTTILGDLEMDVGLFDEVSSRPEWVGDDRECFYQLLAAVGRVGARQLSRAVPEDGRNASVTPLFNQPDKQRGRLVELTGTARQAVQRRVNDPDIVARFGIDHYYEMEIFTDDSQGNPITFCVRDLPKNFPEGDKITEPVRVAGFYFKRWGYRQSDAPQVKARKQLSPLLIGREPVWIETPPVDQRFVNGVVLVLLVALTIVLWLVVMFLARGDRRFHKQFAGRFMPPPAGSLNDVEIYDEGKPTFGETHRGGSGPGTGSATGSGTGIGSGTQIGSGTGTGSGTHGTHT